PKGLLGSSANSQRVVIRTDVEIGKIRPELHGQFAEHVGSCIYGGIWVGRNSAIPNINGFRRQAVAYLRELGVPVIRWPGGCFADDYHWREGLGPAERRPRRVNLSWGGYVEDNSFGTHEFIEFCRLIGAEPYLVGNVGSGSPEEMRDWVEYCNYASKSSLAAERAAHGSPQPFGIRYWGAGNENWGCGGRMTAKEYVDIYRRFATFLPTFGGMKPFLIACGPDRNDLNWSREFMDGMNRRRTPQGFAMHYYAEGKSPSTAYTAETMDAQLATFPDIEQAVIQQCDLLESYHPGRKIALLLDEWGVHDRLLPQKEAHFGRLWQESTMRSALAVGLGLNLFNRQADKLYMCNLAQMVNVRAPLLQTNGPNGEQCIRTSVYYVYSLFKPHRSKTAVKVDPGVASPGGLSVSASIGEGELVLSLVNPSADQEMEVECTLKGKSAAGSTAQILHDAVLNAYNTFDDPDLIVPRPHAVQIEGSKITLDLPKLSVATVIVRLG
ncbi:MAG: alpha-N-arabinofuranosidase, partial [Terriglobia bacterium]